MDKCGFVLLLMVSCSHSYRSNLRITNSHTSCRSSRNQASLWKLSAKATTVYVCESCGNEHIKWVGRCTSCDEWNTVKQLKLSAAPSKLESLTTRTKDNSIRNYKPLLSGLGSSSLISLSDVSMTKEIQRIHLWSEEVNNVLGGGLVRGSAVLIAGDPGVGKSTLLLQLSASVAETSSSGVVYLSGEENAEQILSRVHRLGLSPKNIFLLCDTDADSALTTIMGMEFRPTLVIVDSIQMMRTQTGSGVGAAGSVTQIRDSAALFVEFAKTSGCAVMLVGHVTKSGEVAGPRVLEHLVDTVLYLEASEKGSCRLFRCIKNRFGATNEVGVLSMTPGGLVDVPNPSELFMGESVVSEGLEGCAVAVVLEGTRPLLAEIQCLVGTAKSGQLQGMPKSSRRASDGFPSQRLLLICAVIEKHIGLNLASRDIYLNVVGGLRVSEPAADLAVAVTVVSSFLEVNVKPAFAFVGEVGLGGELRGGGLNVEIRVHEALRMGFRRVIVPAGILDGASNFGDAIIPCRTLLVALKSSLDLAETDDILSQSMIKRKRRRGSKQNYRDEEKDAEVILDTATASRFFDEDDAF